MPISAPRQREFVLWGLFFAALFATGWIRGSSPDLSWKKFFSSGNQPLVILTSDRSWIPDSVVQKISEKLEQKIIIETVEEFADFEARLVPVDSPHLVWLPASWAEVLGAQGLLTDLSSIEDVLHEKVSPDFLSPGEKHPTFVPLLWSVKNKVLRVEGFAMAHGGRDPREALNLLQTWLMNENALAHVKAVPETATALVSLDDQDLPYERRAKALRDQDFRVLKIK